jgi:hypothetical protein
MTSKAILDAFSAHKTPSLGSDTGFGQDDVELPAFDVQVGSESGSHAQLGRSWRQLSN